MPDFSSLFAKRTSQDASKEISDFLTGKKNFNALSQPAQFVLNGLEKDEHHRTFMEQSQIHELQQNLVKGKQISADSGAWEQFENSFRSFIHTSGSRNKVFVPPPAKPTKQANRNLLKRSRTLQLRSFLRGLYRFPLFRNVVRRFYRAY